MDFLQNENLKTLVKHFEDNGHRVRIVGGAVRDYLLGIPCKDIDLCTDATPDEMVELASKLNLHMIPTGLQHGTVTFVIRGEPMEVTTLRIDVETDGRHAQVEFTRDFQVDASRRDLTINAMSMDLDGTVYDYFQGKRDLSRNIVRFVGDAEQRVREDFLRVFRYFRFKTRMNEFEQTPTELENFFKSNEVHKGVAKLSGERIWAEVKKILASDMCYEVIGELCDYGLLAAGLQFSNLQDGPYSSNPHFRAKSTFQEVIGHYGDKVNSNVRETMLMAQFATLFSQRVAKNVGDRLKFSVRERKSFELAINEMSSYSINGSGNADMWSWVYQRESEGFEIDVIKGMAIAMSAYRGNSASFPFQLFDANFEIHRQTGFVPFTVSGQDLIELGMRPGPQMGQVIKAARMVWVNNGFVVDTAAILAELFANVPDPSQVYVLRKAGSKFADYVSGKIERGDVRTMQSTFWRKASMMRNDDISVAVQVTTLDCFNDMEMLVFMPDKAAAMVLKLEDEFFADAK